MKVQVIQDVFGGYNSTTRLIEEYYPFLKKYGLHDEHRAGKYWLVEAFIELNGLEDIQSLTLDLGKMGQGFRLYEDKDNSWVIRVN